MRTVEKPNVKLFSFESDDAAKRYIVYTDNSVDEDGNTKVFASIYKPDSDEQRLMTIGTEKERKIILEELQAGIKGSNE